MRLHSPIWGEYVLFQEQWPSVSSRIWQSAFNVGARCVSPLLPRLIRVPQGLGNCLRAVVGANGCLNAAHYEQFEGTSMTSAAISFLPTLMAMHSRVNSSVTFNMPIFF